MYSAADLKSYSTNELVRLYRGRKSKKEKSRIFEVILFCHGPENSSWHQAIMNHIKFHGYGLFYYDLSLDESDIYQEVMQNFLKTIEEWFDPDVANFNTYAWRVIKSSIDRLYQWHKTGKRDSTKDGGKKIEVSKTYSGGDGNNKKNEEVINSDGDFGIFRTQQKRTNFEQQLLHNDIISFIEESFRPTCQMRGTAVAQDLTRLIMTKSTSGNILSQLAIQYDMAYEEVVQLKQELERDLDNQIFADMVRFLKFDIHANELIAEKYECSQGQITKMKRKLREICQKRIKGLGVKFTECF